MSRNEQIMSIIKAMTLEEKASLCSGKDFWHMKEIERLGLPSIMVTDGPHGLRKQKGDGDHIGLNTSVPATCFPTPVGLASTWNNELMFKVGTYLGEECLQEGVSVILGPGANIKRNPLCGRNFEYFSEDPYLTGELASNLINGVQSQGIGTSLKHFAANNQENHRMVVDTFVDERTLREIYLTGFETAVKKSQPWTVMCAYNKINGTYCSENKYILYDILKKEWQHNGLVVSDWGATNDRVDGLKAGLELEMPASGGVNDKLIVEAVKKGLMDERYLDAACERLIDLILKSKETLSRKQTTYDIEAHHDFAREVSAETIVLLKNEDEVLPLDNNIKVALIGEFAKKPRYQGSGSSLINPIKLDNAYDEMVKLIGKDNVLYARGYSVDTDLVDSKLIEEAVETARKADVVVIMAGLTDLYESEGFDREHMRLSTNHTELIHAVCKVNNKTIIALSNGAPVEMPWVDDVKAIVECYLGGQASGGALVDILFGKVNPSGKLAETFPVKLEDCASSQYFPGRPRQVEYMEGIYVGYRYFDAANKKTLFPFGYGLSYTEFEYSNIQLSKTSMKDDETLSVTFAVKNIGKIAGKEITQVYVKDIDSTIFRPEKELKGYCKVLLNPGEEKTVSITLDKRSFAFYNVDLADWVVESGEFEILVGASSQDIKLSKVIHVTSTRDYVGNKYQLPKCYYNVSENFKVSKEDFETLLGWKIPAYPHNRTFDMNSTLAEIRSKFVGKLFVIIVNKNMKKQFSQDERTKKMMQAFVMEMPLRSIASMNADQFSVEMAKGLLLILNGHFIKGLRKFLKR